MKNFLLLLLAAVVMAAGLAGCGPAGAPGGKAPGAPAAADPAAKSAGPAAKAAAPPAGVPILMYHKIGDEKGNDAVISPARFAEHMEFLHRHGFRTLSLAELDAYLAGRTELPARPVVITFDDGYRDAYEIALPALKRYGFKAVFFVVAADDSRHLTWDELRAMRAAGMEIGSHSYTHRDLGEMAPAEQAAEIARSKELLDRNLGQDTWFFCYPNGSYGGETLRLLKAKGFRLAVTIEPGWAKRGDNPLVLRRVWMGNQVDLRNFELRLTREDYPQL